MLPIRLPGDVIQTLFDEVRANKGYTLTVDLTAQTIAKPDGSTIPFEVDPFRKHCLLNGLDQIGLTLQFAEKIDAYEEQRGMAMAS